MLTLDIGIGSDEDAVVCCCVIGACVANTDGLN